VPLLTFVHVDGHEERLECAEGMSVLECALYYGIAGIRGRCGGVGTCGTCHCSVLGGWLARVAPTTDAEAEVLEQLDDYSERSRLACQIRMSNALSGLRVQWLAPGPTEGAA
jgi:2Fe-2S ferredoxin